MLVYNSPCSFIYLSSPSNTCRFAEQALQQLERRKDCFWPLGLTDFSSVGPASVINMGYLFVIHGGPTYNKVRHQLRHLLSIKIFSIVVLIVPILNQKHYQNQSTELLFELGKVTFTRWQLEYQALNTLANE